MDIIDDRCNFQIPAKRLDRLQLKLWHRKGERFTLATSTIPFIIILSAALYQNITTTTFYRVVFVHFKDSVCYPALS
jgi:hypothetical protein